MKAVVQRVREAKVFVEGRMISTIGKGVVVLLGVGVSDSKKEATYLAQKIANLRIFEDENNKMNLSLLDVQGEVLIVSQFTLYGDCRKGRRPDFTRAAKHDKAQDLYTCFVGAMKDIGVSVKTGQFQARMLVTIHNDGPVTLILET
ncbi:MAG: D-aminoacyl-tRNA deacylase [bacterium]|nr:D-aminoacyl-tRNA deacylase [bacterium]